jgi:type I restriction enzyme S subunit
MSSEPEGPSLADVCTDINYGYTESATDSPIGPKFLRITDIQGGTFNWNTVPFCPASDVILKKYRLEVGDIVIARTGNSTGENAQITKEPPSAVFASYLVRFRPNVHCVNPFFVGYQLRSERFRQHVLSVRSGSAQPGANAKQLGRFPIHLLPRRLQDSAVEILNSIDDRITLLRETNATLEAIAQAIFKSWFVDFDPVRAKMEGRAPEGMDGATATLFPDGFEQSELGLVPKGWRVGTLSEVAHTVRSQLQPSSMHYDLNYVGLEHLPRRSLSLNQWGVAKGLESAKSLFRNGDILFGKLRPYFHKVTVAPIEGVCSTDILVCRPTSPELYGFVTMHLFSDALIRYADRLSNGAKMPRVSWKDLAAYELVIPSIESVAAFTEMVQTLLHKMAQNVHQARNLAILRDTLLPPLISGRLSLLDLEQSQPEVANLI